LRDSWFALFDPRVTGHCALTSGWVNREDLNKLRNAVHNSTVTAIVIRASISSEGSAER
jgi:hypothetical protein